MGVTITTICLCRFVALEQRCLVPAKKVPNLVDYVSLVLAKIALIALRLDQDRRHRALADGRGLDRPLAINNTALWLHLLFGREKRCRLIFSGNGQFGGTLCASSALACRVAHGSLDLFQEEHAGF